MLNVFADSPATSKWRVVAAAAMARWDGRGREKLSDADLTIADRHLLQPLEADPRAHAALNEELKLLYVALTRARRRCVLADTDPTKRAAMFAFLTSPISDGKGGAAPPVAVVGDRPAARRAEFGASGFAQASTTEERAARAASCAARGLLAQAAQCFAWAGREADAAPARAQLAEQQADDAGSEEPERARAAPRGCQGAPARRGAAPRCRVPARRG